MGNIIIFGGTFDPVHIGHLQIYLSIKEKLQFDKFIVVPTKNPPLKKQRPFASTKDRIAMLKLMFGKYKDIEINQYEVDQQSNDYSYTINTIKHFKKVYPNDKLFLVVGLDRYLDFKK
jgi:nicotinate-nucleotide adenylyltransferase